MYVCFFFFNFSTCPCDLSVLFSLTKSGSWYLDYITYEFSIPLLYLMPKEERFSLCFISCFSCLKNLVFSLDSVFRLSIGICHCHFNIRLLLPLQMAWHMFRFCYSDHQWQYPNKLNLVWVYHKKPEWVINFLSTLVLKYWTCIP